jgi:hypothetical protein
MAGMTVYFYRNHLNLKNILDKQIYHPVISKKYSGNKKSPSAFLPRGFLLFKL